MTMSAGTLATAMQAAILSAISPWTSHIDDHRIDLSASAFWTAVTTAIASTTVAHITANAKATGTDSRGDTHNLDIA